MLEFTLLEKVGIVSVTVIGVHVLHSMFNVFYDHCLAKKMMYNKIKLLEMGKWAVVTGASDGVGRAFAAKLAELGLNIVLISRDKAKLDKTAVWIEEEFHVLTRVIVADFTNDTIVAYDEIEKQMYGLEIGVLINNVGMSYPHPEYFLDLPHNNKIYSDIIKCNIFSVTKMCALLMPKMVERGKGVVVNVSSATANIPSPLLTVYAATKGYVECFSRNLDSEYRCQGITIQCLLPGLIATKMSRIKRSSFLAPTPERYVDSAVKLIGIQTICTGYMPHSILAYFIHFVEKVSPVFTGWVIRRTMENLRTRALHKYLG